MDDEELKAKMREYLASLGSKGGSAGTGKAKRRDPEHYKKIAKKALDARIKSGKMGGRPKQKPTL
jgi:hypothetical protein